MTSKPTLEPFEFRDPGELIAEVAKRRPLREGDLVLALVRDPSGDQEIMRLRAIPRTQRQQLDPDNRSQLLVDHARRLRVPQRRALDGPRHSIMTIVARRGYALVGPDEGAWLVAWLFSNHLTDAYAGGLIVVTEHGWADLDTGWGGSEPRIAVGR